MIAFKEKKYVPIWVCVLSTGLSILLTVVCCFGVFHLQTGWFSSFTKNKLAEIQSLISKNAIYGQTDSALTDALANACVAALGDPYAKYYTKEEYETLFQTFQGDYNGIGVSTVEHPQNGTVYVYLVHDNSPAAQAGLQVGDEIIAANGLTIEKDGYNKVVNALLGGLGNELKITYNRNGAQNQLTVSIGAFKIQSVIYKKIQDYGYVYITGFYNNTPEQFKAAVVDLQSQGVKGFIFDLRDNGGGILESVAEVLDYILPSGDVVSVRYANGEEKRLYVSDEQEVALPMAVLTNGHTASASELFAAAVRDYKKGVLVGAATYGKGVTQETVRLFDGSAIKYTNAEFFPPSGQGFNGKGLTPDIPVELTPEQVAQRYLISTEQDSVVQAAIEYLLTAKVGN